VPSLGPDIPDIRLEPLSHETPPVPRLAPPGGAIGIRVEPDLQVFPAGGTNFDDFGLRDDFLLAFSFGSGKIDVPTGSRSREKRFSGTRRPSRVPEEGLPVKSRLSARLNLPHGPCDFPGSGMMTPIFLRNRVKFSKIR
jgi:hypothetical protein